MGEWDRWALESGWAWRARLGEGSSDDLLERLVRVLGVMVHLLDEMPVSGAICGAHVLLRRGLSPPHRRWILAHELGHRVLHAGNILAAYDPVLKGRRDRQADLFAGAFLLGRVAPDATPWMLAEETGLPEARVCWWLRWVQALYGGV